MNSSSTTKPKRQKKKKPRTEVSSDSEVDGDASNQTLNQTLNNSNNKTKDTLTDAEVSEKFTKFYMQRATVEFAEDLDRVRGADDFKGRDSLEILVKALRQGVEGFSGGRGGGSSLLELRRSKVVYAGFVGGLVCG